MRRHPFRTPEGGAVAALVVVGIAARVTRYLACFPFRDNEAFAAATFVSRRFGDLARPLDYQLVCPVGFLWLEGLVVKVLGASEYALRLLPLFFSIAGLLLFARVAGRVLDGPARVFSVGLLAVAYEAIRQSAECRQYASDLFFAVLLVGFTIGFLQAEPRRRAMWWAGLAAALPVSILLSLTSVFVAAGVILAVASSGLCGAAGDDGARGGARLLPAGALALLSAGSFALLWIFQLKGVFEAVRSAGALYVMWEDAFPPLSDPGRLAFWLLSTHTGRMFAYAFGGRNFGSVLTTVLFVLGLNEAGRRRQTGVLLLIGAPFLAGLSAAALRLYPYGGNNTRLVVYLGPGICLMAGLGAGTLLARVREARTRRRILAGVTVVCVVAGLALCADSVRKPYSGIEEYRERRFARQFWPEIARGAEVASLKEDLGIALEPEPWLWAKTGYLASFRYYRAEHGPRPWRAGDTRWNLLGADRPLKAVAWVSRADAVPERERAWLDGIADSYRLRQRQVFSVNEHSAYIVYELVPVSVPPVPLPRFPAPAGANAQ